MVRGGHTLTPSSHPYFVGPTASTPRGTGLGERHQAGERGTREWLGTSEGDVASVTGRLSQGDFSVS